MFRFFYFLGFNGRNIGNYSSGQEGQKADPNSWWNTAYSELSNCNYACLYLLHV